MTEVRRTAELKRILALPRRSCTADYTQLAKEMTELLKTPGGTMHLRPVQALALHDIGLYRGGLLPVGVGEGKTLISFLAPYMLDAKRPMLLLPAGLIENAERERKKLSAHWLIPNSIRIFSYEMLGREAYANELEDYDPDAILCDEAHRLKNLGGAACARRVARRMHKRPETVFVPMSGTIIRDSLHDFAHLAFWSLKGNAPLPMVPHELDEWANVLDEPKASRFGEELERMDPGALLDLCSPEELKEEPHKAARLGFRRRLTETPGVVATAGDGERVDCSIRITGHVYKLSETTDEHFRRLRGAMERPDGYELLSGVDVWRHAKELALGFHYVQAEGREIAKWQIEMRRNSPPTRSESEQGSALQACQKNSANEGARTTELDTQQGHAQRSDVPAHCAGGTESPPSNGKRSLTDRAAAAQSAIARKRDSASTIATRLAALEDCSVTDAITHSGSLATMSREYRRLFNIFLENHRPPPEWLRQRKEWGSFVRAYLSRSRTLDSPDQVKQGVLAGTIHDGGLLEKWMAVENTYEPSTMPVWHDDSVLRLCAEWMRKPGIVWVEHTFFGEGLSALTGLPYYGAQGLSASGEYIEDSTSKTIIASIDANRDGKNLQFKWSRNLLVGPPDGWDALQQCIARTHRPKQIADEVIVDVLIGAKEHVSAWHKAVAGTHAARDTVGGTPKLLLADVSGFPSEDEARRFTGARWQ